MYKNVEDNRANAKRWYWKNREKVLANRRSPEWKKENNERRKKWYARTKPQRNAYNLRYDAPRKEKRLSNKMAVFRHYGGTPPKCSCCGESNFHFLSIDHIHNDGAKHRKEIKRSGGNMFHAWLVKNKMPDLPITIMCYNCNMGKQFNTEKKGICPHQHAQAS